MKLIDTLHKSELLLNEREVNLAQNVLTYGNMEMQMLQAMQAQFHTFYTVLKGFLDFLLTISAKHFWKSNLLLILIKLQNILHLYSYSELSAWFVVGWGRQY